MRCASPLESIACSHPVVRYFPFFSILITFGPPFFEGLWPLRWTLPVVVLDAEPERYVALPVLLNL